MSPRQATWQMGRNTDSISTQASLPYSTVAVKVIEFKKVALSDMQSFKTFS